MELLLFSPLILILFLVLYEIRFHRFQIKELRIIKIGPNSYAIQEPVRTWFGNTGQWKIVGNADYAAVFSSLEEAKTEILHWQGVDTDVNKVVR